MCKQILYRTTTRKNYIFEGIFLPDGNVIDADTGSIIPKERITIVKTFIYWAELSKPIRKDKFHYDELSKEEEMMLFKNMVFNEICGN